MAISDCYVNQLLGGQHRSDFSMQCFCAPCYLLWVWMVVVTADAVLFAAGEAADMAVSGILFMANDVVNLRYDLALP